MLCLSTIATGRLLRWYTVGELHCFILYVPAAAAMYLVTALNVSEWLAML